MKQPTCPVCGEPLPGQSLADWPWLPFCGSRCKTIDLGRWLSESYTFPAEEPDEVPDDSDHS